MGSPGAVRVVGGGVIGLSVACVAAEAGWRVEVVADRPAGRITSAVAAAVWSPYRVGGVGENWAEWSYEHFCGLIEDPSSGVTLCTARRLFTSDAEKQEWERGSPWLGTVPSVGLRAIERDELPAGFAAGVTYRVPVVRMDDYLGYLRARAERGGVRWATRRVAALEDELADVDAVVNCAGLGAPPIWMMCGMARCIRAEDRWWWSMRIRRLRRITFATTGPDFEREPMYIVPRGGKDIVLGSTAEDGREDLAVEQAQAKRIVERCAAVEPAVRGLAIRAVRVGLRPMRRSGIRLQREGRGSKSVVHNYGHGGSGVTLSWGCARAAVGLLG